VTKASDNIFPKVTFLEGSAPSSPAATNFSLFVDSADHLFKWKNSAGAVTTIATGTPIADQGVFTYLDGTVAAAPGTPASGKLRLYAKTGKVLAVKDDAGTETVLGAGSGGVDNWLIQIDAFMGSHGNTNWNTANVDNSEIYVIDLESSGAQNDEIYWDLGISGGTWDLTMLHYKGPNRGIYTVSIDGSSIGTIDGYAAGTTRNQFDTITGASITAGKRRLKLKMATKNGSSSSYFGTMTAIQMRRTA
jgi:hypothetical protein